MIRNLLGYVRYVKCFSLLIIMIADYISRFGMCGLFLINSDADNNDCESYVEIFLHRDWNIGNDLKEHFCTAPHSLIVPHRSACHFSRTRIWITETIQTKCNASQLLTCYKPIQSLSDYIPPDYIPFRIISLLFGISISSLTQWNTSILILIISPFGLYPVNQQYSFPPKNGI